MPSDELLTVDELASFLKLKRRTLYPKVRSGELPAIKIFGQWRFKKSDIDKWIETSSKQGLAFSFLGDSRAERLNRKA